MKQTPLGICIHSCMTRHRYGRQHRSYSIQDPLNFLEYCHQFGAGGIQTDLGIHDEEYCRGFRKRAESYGMFVEGTVGPPRNEEDVDRFEAAVHAAKEMGASVLRTVLFPGRRYEIWDSMAALRQATTQAWQSLQLAEPIVARHRIRLAVENHKDQRVQEKLTLIERLSSEYVGICVDTGNDLSLLEDPMELVRAYAPWAYAVHLKDMAVQESGDGFLLSEVPLGEGILDLPQMVRILRAAQPEVHFTLEMITRDPLCVPCLTERYWTTLGDVPGEALARTLRLVRQRGWVKSLPLVDHLFLDARLQIEEANIRKCLDYAREHLPL